MTRMRRDPDARCPQGHRHGETGTCYQLHGCRCGECTATHAAKVKAHRDAKAAVKPKRNRGMGASRFAEVPFAPIAPCVGEEAARVRSMIAKNAPAAECAELEAMLGVSA